MRKYSLYLTVFITGAVILVLELLGTRIIAPYYGTTIYVWSSLIGVTLMALSFGYCIGGRLADKKPSADFLYSIIFLASLSIIIIPLIMNFVLINTNFLGPRFGALSSSIILFTLPLFLLGMVAPYAIKLKIKEIGKIGITSGNLYGVATIGSFIGAFLTGFYLIPNFGIKSIIYFISSLLILLTAIHNISLKKKLFSFIAVLIFLFLILMPQLIPLETKNKEVTLVYQTESPYAELKVIDYSNLRYLLVDGATHTLYNLKDKSFSFGYLGLFEKAVKYHPNPKEILVIGLGGGGIDKQLEQYNLNIDNIEIDSKVVDVAKKYFDFKGNVIIDDGRHYIKNTNKKYDIIYLDVYNGYSIYPYLFSKEAFIEIKKILNKDGILVINSIGYEDGHLSTNDSLILSIHATLQEVFPNIYVKSRGYGLTNFIFYATSNNLELDKQYVSIKMPSNGIIITDDYNPIEMFSINAVEEWRASNIRRFGNEIIK